MKTILLSTIIVFCFATGCKKDESGMPKAADSTNNATPQPPTNAGPSVEILPPPMRNYIRSGSAGRFSNPDSASLIYLNLPDSVSLIPFPPFLRPLKNLKLVERTDTTALYTFNTARRDAIGEMYLTRTLDGTDTVWIMLHMVPKPAAVK